MARDIDDKQTKKALRKLRKAKSRAESKDGPGLTDWEKEFFDGVEERLETFGSAFADPEKGNLDSALSAKQTHIVREIDKKSRKKDGGLKRSSFKPKKSKAKSKSNFKPRGRDINEDLVNEEASAPPPKTITPKLKIVDEASNKNIAALNNKNSRQSKSPFRIIQGGKKG